jgi:hypothetical protein
MSLHTVAPAHPTMHSAEPAQSTVHPPAGQWMLHVLLPSHVIVEPASRVTSQRLPPAHVTWLLAPVASVHWLVPAQLEVQFVPQVPEQVERPSQVLVQPLPHVRSHWFCESQ